MKWRRNKTRLSLIWLFYVAFWFEARIKKQKQKCKNACVSLFGACLLYALMWSAFGCADKLNRNRDNMQLKRRTNSVIGLTCCCLSRGQLIGGLSKYIKPDSIQLMITSLIDLWKRRIISGDEKWLEIALLDNNEDIRMNREIFIFKMREKRTKINSQSKRLLISVIFLHSFSFQKALNECQW